MALDKSHAQKELCFVERRQPLGSTAGERLRVLEEPISAPDPKENKCLRQILQVK
jgi:hypothetical protein